MMVLLEKHVHLQNDGGARILLALSARRYNISKTTYNQQVLI
jgi:hypothetical protein